MSKLKVNKGIKQPEVLNKDAAKKFVGLKKAKLSATDYFNGITKGDISILSRAITIVESNLDKDKKLANDIIKLCLPKSGNAVRIGITGVPGVGKSTFIESFGKIITNKGLKLAVLAVDPSSNKSKGSILGDKTRMELLSQDKMAFIRPSPSAGSLGGVARKSAETIMLCEAAGYDYILIETVGVGQSEVLVHSMVDFFLLLMLAGAGDELQGMKRGIMEMADMIAITKSDGENIKKAKLAKAEYENALHLYPANESGYFPKVMTCSSLENTGITEIYQEISEYIDFTKKNKYFYTKRALQNKQKMYNAINEKIIAKFYSDKNTKAKIKELEKMVEKGEINPFEVVENLIR
jgi:LAO/AO transport system kinase